MRGSGPKSSWRGRGGRNEGLPSPGARALGARPEFAVPDPPDGPATHTHHPAVQIPTMHATICGTHRSTLNQVPRVSLACRGGGGSVVQLGGNACSVFTHSPTGASTPA